MVPIKQPNSIRSYINRLSTPNYLWFYELSSTSNNPLTLTGDTIAFYTDIPNYMRRSYDTYITQSKVQFRQ